TTGNSTGLSASDVPPCHTPNPSALTSQAYDPAGSRTWNLPSVSLAVFVEGVGVIPLSLRAKKLISAPATGLLVSADMTVPVTSCSLGAARAGKAETNVRSRNSRG